MLQLPSPHCRRLAIALAVVGVLVAASGCQLSRRSATSEQVLTGRQLSLRGLDAMQQQRWDEAEMLFAQAIQEYPVDERAHCRYAELLWRRGAYSEAIAHMEEAVRLSGGNPQLLVDLGQMYLERGHVARAAQRAERAVAINPELPSAWALDGDVQLAQSRFGQAITSYHRALRHEPHLPRVQLALARAYQAQGQPHRALVTVGALVHQYPPNQIPSDVLQLEGLLLSGLGRYDDAVERLAAAAEQQPHDAQLLYQLAQARLELGDLAGAQLAALAALELAPADAASQQLKSQIDARQHRLSAAVSH